MLEHKTIQMNLRQTFLSLTLTDGEWRTDNNKKQQQQVNSFSYKQFNCTTIYMNCSAVWSLTGNKTFNPLKPKCTAALAQKRKKKQRKQKEKKKSTTFVCNIFDVLFMESVRNEWTLTESPVLVFTVLWFYEALTVGLWISLEPVWKTDAQSHFNMSDRRETRAEGGRGGILLATLS